MKRTCSNGVLDFDAMNAFLPDGEKIFCQFTAAGYGAGADGRSDGPFVQTDDTGLVRLRDMAFKMLCDLCIRAGVDSLRYLYSEAARGAAKDDVPGGLLKLGGEGNVPEALECIGLSHVMLPDLSLALERNLDILEDHDAYGELRAMGQACEPLAKLAGILEGFLYIAPGRGSFANLLDGFEELFGSLPADDLRMFVNAFYGMLDQVRPAEFSGAATKPRTAVPSAEIWQLSTASDPAPVAARTVSTGQEPPDGAAEPSAEEGVPDVPDVPEDGGSDEDPGASGPEEPADGDGGECEPVPEVQDGTGSEDGGGPGEPEPQAGTESGDRKDTGAPVPAPAQPAGSSVRGVSVGALVGADETYTSDYESERYEKALETADSDGLLEATVKSRANGTDGPIDVLTLKAAASQAFGTGDAVAEREAQNLREHLSGLRGEAVEAAGGEENVH